MFSSSGRAQTEPLAALVAVAAVGLGLSLYAGTVDGTLQGPADRALAEHTLDRVERTVGPDGVVRPDALTAAPSVAPDGHRIAITVLTEDRQWTEGPAREDVRDRASRPVSVRVGPADVRPGTLRVAVLR